MSATLNLVDCLLFSARNLRDLGQDHAAARLFSRLAGLRDLPADLAEEAQASLAEIELGHDRFKQARRHLTVALTHQPDCAHYHYLLAVAVADDPDSDPKRAGVHYRRCLANDPDHFDCLCDYGVHSLRHGQKRAALTALRRAAMLTDDVPEALGRVAAGLREADKSGEARELLRAAMFRHPRERRFRDLWDRHQFDMLRVTQQKPSERWTPTDDGPVVLPFRRPRKKSQRVGGKTIRIDAASDLKGPTILPMHATRKKNA